MALQVSWGGGECVQHVPAMRLMQLQAEDGQHIWQLSWQCMGLHLLSIVGVLESPITDTLPSCVIPELASGKVRRAITPQLGCAGLNLACMCSGLLPPEFRPKQAGTLRSGRRTSRGRAHTAQLRLTSLACLLGFGHLGFGPDSRHVTQNYLGTLLELTWAAAVTLWW